MANDPMDAIARVECRSEARGEEKPVAVVFGGRRLEVVAMLDRAVLTSADAGSPVRHRLWVELEDGTRCELMRIMPDGEWRVRVEDPSGSGAGSGTGSK